MVEGKNKRTNTDLGQLQAQERSMWHFCAALRAFAGYRGRVFARNFHKATRNANSFLALVSPASIGQQVLAVVFLTSVILSSLPSFHLPNWPVLSTGPFRSFQLTVSFSSLWPSFLHPPPVSWEISRASSFCGFRVKKDKGIL